MTRIDPSARRARFPAGAITLAAALVLSSVSPAHAAPPSPQVGQAPGYYRMALGDFTVTALYDGYVDLDPKLLKGVNAKDVQSLLARMFLKATPGVQTAVNAFLVHTGSNLVLIDAGAAKAFGPTLGVILDNIRAAGYDPAQVDTVLLTHLHGDHASGLVVDGKPAFPNAQVRVAKADADFWLSEEIAAKAPEAARPFFKLARDAVAPYQAAGKFMPYSGGASLVPGITAVPAYGHTPGHSAYLLKSKDQSLLVWGDIVHSHSVQFQRPEVALEFDVDSTQAIATRRKLFADAARDKLWVAGAHLPFPGIGHVRADGKRYAWVPVEYGPIRSDR
jgi:glyoxylase-like metal-dependent hydrolase (beta-lactamase superfamily II)